ncbi:MAG: helix-turn-helix domain-containing protein [Elusimicrobiales bacterium]|nr:helix-turn-helix domain-containing protein [Elusimicrobiales bacterium]
MKTDIYSALGAAVRAFRKKQTWSQEELGERAGLHPSYIGQIERGTKKISLLTLQKLAAALKVKIADLLSEKAPDQTPSSWETRILAIIKDRPQEQQKKTYMILREALRPYPGRRK